MSELLSGPVVESLGWALLHFLWQGALVAAAYAALRLLLQRAPPSSRVLAGYGALLALALAPLATFCWTLGRATAPAATAGGAAAPMPALAGEPAAGLLEGVPVDGALVERLLPWLVAAWLVGVLLLSARSLRQWRALQRLCAIASPVEPAWQQRLDALRRRMGVRQMVQLRECALVAAPMLVGLLKPVVLLPVALCTRLPAEQLELLLAHELAHVRRLDYLANLLQMALETVLFYHPAVHWISRCVRQDRELSCDDMVTALGASRISYARALLTVAEQNAGREAMPALAATGGVLLSRIEHIVAAPRRRAPPATAASTPLLLLAASVLVATLGLRAYAPAVLSRAPLPALAGLELALPAWRVAVPDLAPQFAIELPRLLAPAPEVASAPVQLPQPAALGVAPLGAGQVLAEDAPIALQLAPLELATGATAAGNAPATALPQQQEAAAVDAAAAGGAASPTSVADGLVPLSVHQPAYPRRARMAGVEGHVTLSYSIGSDGRPLNVQVDDASPLRTFDRAARDALLRWRFPAAAAATGRRYQQTFDFVLDGSASRNEDCVVSTGSRLCRPAL